MKEIKYALRGVTIDQFATVFEPASDNVEINISIPIKTNYGGRALAVGANIQFTEAGRPFMVAEAFCHYEIEEACWNDLSDGGKTSVALTKQFMDALARIAIGTLRGAICVKTENTPFAKYCLPIIEIGASQECEDFIISKE